MTSSAMARSQGKGKLAGIAERCGAEMKRRRPLRACADLNAFDHVPLVVVNFAVLLIITDVPAISMAMLGAAH